MKSEDFKRQAAEAAAAMVADGMRLGLGTGSTARHFVDFVGAKVKAGMNLACVPTSEDTAAQAVRLGITLTTLDETPELDLTVDGADEIDPSLRLIKGAGGALLREKIVAAASKRMVVIADDSKCVARLGAAPLPIEIVPFGMAATRRAIDKALAGIGVKAILAARLDRDGTLFVTDEGHHILDARLGEIAEPETVASVLAEIPGIVEHGLFLGLANQAILAGPQGLRILDAPTKSAQP